MKKKFIFYSLFILFGCGQPSPSTNKIPKVVFIDAFEDETLSLARVGFFDALKKNGFDDKANTLKIVLQNAQGSIPTLNQIVSYAASNHANLIATNSTLPTIAAVQRIKNIPIFMIVAPSPAQAKITDKDGKAPSNLFGVYETLDYIDTAVTLMKTADPHLKAVGVIYNQSENQSENAFSRLLGDCKKLGIRVEALPVNNSSESLLVMNTLIAKKIDAFFALPDNSVFSSFETIRATCDRANVPIFTSEQGLVKRGAMAAFGADMYRWGFQSGEQAAAFLKNHNTEGLHPDIVKVHNKVYNKKVASRFHFLPSADYKAVD